MPIDTDFMKRRKKVGKEKGIVIWGPVDPPKKLRKMQTLTTANDIDIHQFQDFISQQLLLTRERKVTKYMASRSRFLDV